MQNEKNVSVSNVKTASEKNLKNDFANLEKLLSKFKNQKISERSESIYKDTEHLKDFDGGKKWRNKTRKQLEKISFAFVQAMKTGTKEKQKETFSAFEKFYAETYVSNSFTVSSVYSGTNENRIEYLTNFFELCKIFKSM